MSKRHKLILVIFLILSNIQSNAQYLSPVTQNIGGTLGLQSNYTLTFSVGEMVSISNFVGSDKTSISTGFLQSFTPLVTGIDDLALIAPGVISIMPNPIVSKMFLKANFSKPGEFAFNIVDLTSNLRYQSATFSVFGNINKEVDISNFVSGEYYVRVLFKPNSGKAEYGIYKLIKL